MVARCTNLAIRYIVRSLVASEVLADEHACTPIKLAMRGADAAVQHIDIAVRSIVVVMIETIEGKRSLIDSVESVSGLVLDVKLLKGGVTLDRNNICAHGQVLGLLGREIQYDERQAPLSQRFAK
jgi:hypothetical protein